MPRQTAGKEKARTRARELRQFTFSDELHTGLCKGPVLLSTSQAQQGRTFLQLSNLSFARPCSVNCAGIWHKMHATSCF